jgi:hypothetical protein
MDVYARERRREAFKAKLFGHLRSCGIVPESLTIGRGPGNEPFWIVLICDAGRYRSKKIVLSAGTDPLGDAAFPAIVSELVGVNSSA